MVQITTVSIGAEEDARFEAKQVEVWPCHQVRSFLRKKKNKVLLDIKDTWNQYGSVLC